MGDASGLQSIKEVVSSIRKVMLSDVSSQDDILCLENPEDPDTDLEDELGKSPEVVRGTGRVRHSKSFCGSVEREVQQRQISCSMELTESSSLTSFSDGDEDQDKDSDDSLLSSESIAEATEEIRRLVNAATASENPSANTRTNTSPTIEELALSALRPQIAEWLNKNLRGLVGDIVEREIHKIVRKSVPDFFKRDEQES
ncbi:MAG: DUF2497 domain-containing protein [Anaplasma sp.]